MVNTFSFVLRFVYYKSMRLNLHSIHKHYPKFVSKTTVDISSLKFIDPWALVSICLYLIENADNTRKTLILPQDIDVLTYLKRMRFDVFLGEIGYSKEAGQLMKFDMGERKNLNAQEITYCKYRDEFNANLENFIRMFANFGLCKSDTYRATALVGELGNNVFDHNSGNWPTDIGGCIIAGQNYPKKKLIEIAVGDPGIGFKQSLEVAFPNLSSDIAAIKKGLAGFTGRIGEKRGNGLKLIQEWVLKNFSGNVIIQSGKGLVIVNQKGTVEREVPRILGTVASLVIKYK
ncbi:hypothetical protein KKB40_00560 [Patescibacteria group bacterium]|nr:hypothetical protein [Patescibacteria group bacterium]